MSAISRDTVREIRDRADLAGLIGRAVRLKRHGREFMGLCPFHNERTPSFTVVAAKGFFHCFGCGAHGDAIGFVMRHERVEWLEAVQRLAAELGIDTGPGRAERAITHRAASRPIVDDAEDAQRRLERAVAIWREAAPAAGTAVEAYLRGRGITIPVPPTLRCHPGLDYWQWDEAREDWDLLGRWPAMVAPIQAPDRSVIGIHRTWILADGSGKAPVAKPKRMLGAAWDGAIRLSVGPGPDGTMCGGEGIETTLSVMQSRPGLAGWAAGSLGNLVGAGHPRARGRPHPSKVDRDGRPILLPAELPDLTRQAFTPPAGTKRFIFLADGDMDMPICRALMARGVLRLRARGIDARVAWPTEGMDFNDMLRAAA